MISFLDTLILLKIVGTLGNLRVFVCTGRLSLIRQLWDREGAGLSIFPDY